MLQEKCKTHFDSAIRARGQEYYLEKAVSLLREDEKSVLATVKGVNTTYRVGMVWKVLGNTDIMQVSCMCPYFERWGPCKHIWASILAVDNGLFTQFYRGRRLEIRPVAPDAEIFQGDAAVFREYAQSQWRNKLNHAVQGSSDASSGQHRRGKKIRLAWYGLHAEGSEQSRMATIQLYYQEERKTGEYGKRQPLSLTLEELSLFVDPIDREILGRFCSYVPQKVNALGGSSAVEQAMTAFQIHPDFYEEIFPLLAKTRRFRLTSYMSEGIEDAEPITQWQPMPGELIGLVNSLEEGYTLEPALKAPGQLKATGEGEPWILSECGLAMQDSMLFPLRKTQGLSLIWELTQANDFEFPKSDRDQFVEEFLSVAEASSIELPEDWEWESVDVELKPILSVATPHQLLTDDIQIPARVSFDYIIDGEVFAGGAGSKTVDRESKRIFKIDLQEKEALLAPLEASSSVKLKKKRQGDAEYEIRSSGLFDLVQELSKEGWEVRTEKQTLKQSSGAKIEVLQSRVDWFELGGHVQFGDEKVEFPELLKQLSKNQGFVRLESGEIGIIPKKWLMTWTKLAELSSSRGHLEFSKDQSFILDLLLQQLDADTSQSRAFQDQLKNLGELSKPEPSQPHEAFSGQLRHYQEQGLGWMEQLARAGVGGCLADDMGLGKTVQVLALLQKVRRNATSKLAPDLIVAPKSLVFNWGQELARFTPELKALDYTGAQRDISQISKCDIIFTTYGTLRRDIVRLRDFEFNYVVLDEAHAIKNGNSQSSKACRLLQASHRLALTGTPIENRLSELASLFQFLNPGLMGSKMHSVLSKEVKPGSEERDWRPIVLQAIRPFVMRRTKKEVLPELPEKNEQVVYCQLSPNERKDYDKLKNWYRASLSKTFENQGLQQSKMHVLEALLRLRQAACHRALLSDMSHKKNLKSSKLEMLFEMLNDLTQSHKVLIFSQFTSLLAHVEKEVKEREWDYCYLDGQTSSKKRQQEVERFQTDDNARLFLLSLKAGGHGLNLTAAEYCFILDPWWNPAAEAQAVDRMYRIGQTKEVYSFRIISKDTVEEKILELQESKKNLADEFWTSGDRGLAQLNENEILELFS